MKTFLIFATIAAWMAVLASSAEAMPLQNWHFEIGVSCPGHRAGLTYYRGEAHRYERLLGIGRTLAVTGERTVGNCDEAIPVLSRWRNLAARRSREYVAFVRAIRATGIPPGTPPHKAQWICIHGFEGAWNDPNPPYYGGLQMDLGFQRTYGGKLLTTKGTANNWTPHEQMWVAERAFSGYAGHRARGFYPWPNTARYCGLI